MGLKSKSALLILIATTAALMACGKQNNRDNAYGDNTNGIVVDVPTASTCMNGSQAAPASWTPYQQHGFRQYDWNYGQVGNYGFCGCPQGYQPACGSNVGMACVPSQYMPNPNQLTWWGWNAQSNNFYQNTSYAGYSDGIYTHTYGSYACTSGISQLCQVGAACGINGQYGICRQLQPGSNVGVCVRY